MARRQPRAAHRPTLLSHDVHKRIIEATSNGAPMWAAAAYAGVSTRAFEKWMARGYNEEMRVTEEEGTVPDDDEQPYRQLFLDMQTARAQAVVRNAAVVQKAAIGGIVTEVTTKKYRDPGTGEVVEERTEKRTPPDWRASAWWLERRDPGSFGKAAELAVEVSGPGGGPVQVEAVSAADLAAKVRGNIAVLTAAAATAQEIHGADVVDADLVEDGEG